MIKEGVFLGKRYEILAVSVLAEWQMSIKARTIS